MWGCLETIIPYTVGRCSCCKDGISTRAGCSPLQCVQPFSVLCSSMYIVWQTGTAWEQQQKVLVLNAKVKETNNPQLIGMAIFRGMVKTSLQSYMWFVWFPLCLCWNTPSALARLCLCSGVLWSAQILFSFPIHGEKCSQTNIQGGCLINWNF